MCICVLICFSPLSLSAVLSARPPVRWLTVLMDQDRTELIRHGRACVREDYQTIEFRRCRVWCELKLCFLCVSLTRRRIRGDIKHEKCIRITGAHNLLTQSWNEGTRLRIEQNSKNDHLEEMSLQLIGVQRCGKAEVPFCLPYSAFGGIRQHQR